MAMSNKARENDSLAAMVQETFGRLLRARRIELGLNQEDIAAAAGVDRTYVSLLERGQRQPTVTVLIQISRAMKLEPEHVLAQVVKSVPRRR